MLKENLEVKIELNGQWSNGLKTPTSSYNRQRYDSTVEKMQTMFDNASVLQNVFGLTNAPISIQRNSVLHDFNNAFFDPLIFDS